MQAWFAEDLLLCAVSDFMHPLEDRLVIGRLPMGCRFLSNQLLISHACMRTNNIHAPLGRCPMLYSTLEGLARRICYKRVWRPTKRIRETVTNLHGQHGWICDHDVKVIYTAIFVTLDGDRHPAPRLQYHRRKMMFVECEDPTGTDLSMFAGMRAS